MWREKVLVHLYTVSSTYPKTLLRVRGLGDLLEKNFTNVEILFNVEKAFIA